MQLLIVAEREQETAVVGKHFLGVPVRRGDQGVSTAHGVGQRPAHDLRLVPVGRQVDVSRRQVGDQRLQIHEAVVK